ncbi:MAG: transposase [Elusimicrobia bacterium]|nr:transposase [Elusimicrobiota bacterium]
MYINDKNTPKLFPNFFHFGNSINADNRWLKLSKILPWEKLDRIYGSYFSENIGRRAKDSRLICGLLIVKYLKNSTNEEVLQEFSENPYIQAFCGCEYFSSRDIISPSILSERKKRLGQDFFDFFYGEVADILKTQKSIKFKDLPGKRKNFFDLVLNKLKNIFK